ncbi:FAD:protein FMN transferase, partial [uncultured Eudoraea sp.]|uniref:FAD:protein FMN transferase n=1 Tax=uncultured Eudoraea sp. TaxID=1035614 RepID=UPI002602FDF2
YVHTIDPKTGYTRNSNILAVSVIANDCARADAYATAMMAMELIESKKLLNLHEQLDAYIIYLEKDGEVAEFMTPGFKKLVVR